MCLIARKTEKVWTGKKVSEMVFKRERESSVDKKRKERKERSYEWRLGKPFTSISLKLESVNITGRHQGRVRKKAT